MPANHWLPNYFYRVCALHEQAHQPESFIKISNLQIFSVKSYGLVMFFFLIGLKSLTDKLVKSVSKSQAG